jgi:hypothetical protein
MAVMTLPAGSLLLANANLMVIIRLANVVMGILVVAGAPLLAIDRIRPSWYLGVSLVGFILLFSVLRFSNYYLATY